ncbi:CIC11C00000005017 [Sungouiella intermedia]|uniref:CIC11C00000005017 n=1 Tax=Sungouiella intermedia TaxID=45354 RepID=A0A1L0C2Q9_9ASCO|nr:CIC11C00000005017 [[Candida] intermedia]
MKKYQLMGRRKVSSVPKKHTYQPLHLHSMPYEILMQIFAEVAEDMPSLLLLALVCSKFNNIVSKSFIYHTVKFKSTHQFAKFCQAHLPLKTSLGRRFGTTEPSSKVNLIRCVHFDNPPTHDPTSLTQIAGTYSVDTLSGTTKYQDFVSQMKSLLNEAYGIKEVRLTEISPQFEFPLDLIQTQLFSSIKLRFKAPKPSRKIEKVVLVAQSGWKIPFKLGHISLFIHVFDEISELKLNKFVINDLKILCDLLQIPFSIDCLVLTASVYSDCRKPNQKRVPSKLFAKTTSLLLEDIQHGNDLCLIDFIKCNDDLSRLSIDIGSSIFYYVDPQDQTVKFNFSKYNNFFKLVCSGKGGYSKLKEVVLTNFDLFNSFSHQHESKLDRISEEGEEDDWVEKPTNTFEHFMTYLSQVTYLTIVVKEAPAVMHTCVNCGFTVTEKTKSISSLLPHEWAIILSPILANRHCSVLIYNHKLRPLFSRRAVD